MSEKVQVVVHKENLYGLIEYDAAANSVTVAFPDPEIKAQIEAYLAQAHDINVPQETLLDFSVRTFRSTDSLKSFQTILTRMWNTIGVHVDWSIPADKLSFMQKNCNCG